MNSVQSGFYNVQQMIYTTRYPNVKLILGCPEFKHRGPKMNMKVNKDIEPKSVTYEIIVFPPCLDTVGHRRQVTVNRLPRWRRVKIRLHVRPLLTLLRGMDRCYFWHGIRYWIGLTCDAVMVGHCASK